MNLTPDFLFESIYTIDPTRLRARGVTLLLADLDNTLAPYGVQTPSEEVRAWKEQMEAAGVTLFILSNSRKPGRAARFAQDLGVPYEGHAGKPKGGGFRRAMGSLVDGNDSVFLHGGNLLFIFDFIFSRGLCLLLSLDLV